MPRYLTEFLFFRNVHGDFCNLGTGQEEIVRYWNLTGYYERDGKIRLSGPCIVTGKPFSVVVSREGVRNYFERRALAQEAFPELSKEEREFLISGISPEGWREIFTHESEAAPFGFSC